MICPKIIEPGRAAATRPPETVALIARDLLDHVQPMMRPFIKVPLAGDGGFRVGTWPGARARKLAQKRRGRPKDLKGGACDDAVI